MKNYFNEYIGDTRCVFRILNLLYDHKNNFIIIFFAFRYIYSPIKIQNQSATLSV